MLGGNSLINNFPIVLSSLYGKYEEQSVLCNDCLLVSTVLFANEKTPSLKGLSDQGDICLFLCT
jgi:hypothetical protein